MVRQTRACGLIGSACIAIDTQSDTLESTPRVGLLDRKLKRGLSNLDDVLLHMRGHWQTTLGYMEGKSFVEQIRWFHNHDVVVSPHGAQSASVAFMPVCGAFLEFHTKYAMFLWCFAGLAADSGLITGFLYLSKKTMKADMLTDKVRHPQCIIVNRWIREHKVCVPPSAVVAAVKEMITKRNLCIKEAVRHKLRSAD